MMNLLNKQWIERPWDIRHDLHADQQPLMVDDWQMEVVLVHGFSPKTGDDDEAMEYWHKVWDWFYTRWPECCQQPDFPDDWASDPAHEADMEILTCMHRWQRDWRRKLEA